MAQQTLTGTITGTSIVDGYTWDFRGTDTGRETHSMGVYPATMPPELPAQAITCLERQDAITPGDTIVDPYSGSGTVLAEARKAGYHALGTDLNPYATMLSRAKANPPAPASIRGAAREELLTREMYYLCRDIHTAHENGLTDSGSTPTVDDSYSDFSEADPIDNLIRLNKSWFPIPQVYVLNALRPRLHEAASRQPVQIRRVLQLALGATARRVSYQDSDEYKRQRLPPDERETHDLHVLPTLQSVIEEMATAAGDYRSSLPADSPTVTVRRTDCRAGWPGSDTADALICSPPYGDSATTVAYSSVTQIPLLVGTGLRKEQLPGNASLMGGHDTVDSGRLSEDTLRKRSDTAAALLDTLQNRDGRVRDTRRFLSEYGATFDRFVDVCKPGAPAILVVGNRTVSGVPMPLHDITRELATAAGFTFEAVAERSIPNKRIPVTNAPSGICGDTGDTIAHEHLVQFTA